MNLRQLLAGFGVRGFRSFGALELQRVGPMGTVHLLAGPNNAGKSNVLEAVSRTVQGLQSGSRWNSEQTDQPFGRYTERRVAIGLSIWRLEERISIRLKSPLQDAAYAVVNGLADDSGITWIEFEPDAVEGVRTLSRETLDLASEVAPREMHTLSEGQHISENSSRGRANVALQALLQALEFYDALPSVSTIPAGRSLRDIDATFESTTSPRRDGFGLIHELARLQDPPYSRSRDRERFNDINRFIQKLFNDPDAALRVPYERDTLVVYHEGHHLPLTSFGSGLQQVVIIATAATVLDGHLVCIEEPEVHLHPKLQRMLLRYLNENTANQYLIATHSAHMLDANVASITAVTKDGGNSRTEVTIEPQRLFELSALLGARASDLVQTNAVIWVEGPSDRTYIVGWLRCADDGIIEGVHYSVMFYGGSTLSHLGTNPEMSSVDDAAEALIDLPLLNRNMAIVIDSDRKDPNAEINATKQRIQREFDENSAPVWLTDGYTIENYVPSELFEEAICTVHPNQQYKRAFSRFDNPLGPDRFPQNREFQPKKAKLAVEVMAAWGDRPLPQELASRVDILVQLIRVANDL